MIRRFGDPAEPGRRYHLRPGAYAILQLGARVLVTHQSMPRPEYQLPGGGIDPGESPIRALHREVIEETGWSISRPVRLGAFRRFTYMPEYDRWAEKLCVIYAARPVRRLGPPSEPGHRAVWLPTGAAAALLGNDGDRHFLLRALRR
jgi:8-oxo-dGTP diphosphatase